MEEHRHHFDFLNAHFLFAAFAIVVTPLFVAGAAFGADKTPRVNRAELRIQDMHARLMITAAQEKLWGKVAQVMRNNMKETRK